MPRVPSPPGDDPGADRGVQVPAEVLRSFFGAGHPPLRRLEGGFSGLAPFLAGEPACGRGWVLKRFPPGTSLERVGNVHSVLAAARSAALAAVPPLRSSVDPSSPRTTVVADAAGGLWEAAGWRPGRPVARPSIRQAEAAGRLLAAVHRAVRICGHDDHRPMVSVIRVGDRVIPPGLQDRLSRVRSLSGAAWSQRAGSALGSIGAFDEEATDTAALVLRTAAAVERSCEAVRARLAAAAPPPMVVQWVLRDARSDHLLYVDDRVEGLVDWHAAGIDSPLGDLARLLGDWTIAAGDGEPAHRRAWWRACLDAYGGLEADDRGLVRLLHESALFGALDNWFTWVIEERRRFPDWFAVSRRVAAIGRCLVGLA